MSDAENVIKSDYVSDKTLNEIDIEDIKKEYDFKDIKNTLDEGDIPSLLDFFYGGESEKFCIKCVMLGLNKDNAELVDFICSQQGEELFKTIVFLYTWKVEIFFMTVLTQMIAFMIFYLLNKTKSKK